MSEAALCGTQRLFVFIALTAICLVLGTYHLQSRKSCSSMKYQPLRVMEYPPTTVLPLVSKGIIVRSVYFDDRPRNGHQTASVFMVEARRGLVDKSLILGCQIGKYFSNYTKVRQVDLMWYVHKHYPHINHDLFMVDCFDLPVKNGSRAFLVFKNGTSKGIESERPLFLPAP